MIENASDRKTPRARHFDASYRERVSLLDGGAATLRLIRPSDRDLLRHGLERLSLKSRYQRFFTAKRKLSERELTYLTQIDNETHLAIGAATEGPEGVEEGLAIARFVRSAAQPDHAEAAVAVIDDWHGKGLGTLLLLRLTAAAWERGIRYFTAQVQCTNQAMRSLLGAVPAAMIQPVGHETLQMSIRLPEVSVDARVFPRESHLGQVFRMTRAEAIVVEPAPLWPE